MQQVKKAGWQKEFGRSVAGQTLPDNKKSTIIELMKPGQTGCPGTKEFQKFVTTTKTAFTLAETLITLVIVGIVAAVTVPAVMTNINSKQKEEKLNNVYHKLSESTDKMLGISGMNGYNSTEEFLNAFKNHLSISKICKPENIKDCWGSKEVTLTDGEKYDISNVKTTRDLKISKSSNPGFKDVMGFVTNDGTPFLVSYNTECDMSLSDGKVWSGHQSTSSNCIAGVFDYNGGRKPNKLTDDVINFNASAGLGSACAFEVNGNCYTAPQVATFVSKSQCEAMVGDTYGIQYCNYDTDYWAGAVKMCGGVSKMADKNDLKTIAQEIYGNDVTINDSGWSYCNGVDNSTNCFTTTNSVAQKYGISPNTWFWSAEETTRSYSYLRLFRDYGSAYNHCVYRNTSGGRVLCKGD